MNPHYSRRLAIGYALLPLLLAAAACWALLSGSGSGSQLRTILGLPGADDGLCSSGSACPGLRWGSWWARRWPCAA